MKISVKFQIVGLAIMVLVILAYFPSNGIAADGAIRWIKHAVQSDKAVRVYDLAVTTMSKIVIVGEFWGTATFGDGEDAIQSTLSISNNGCHECDAFIACFNADGTLDALFQFDTADPKPYRGGGLFADRVTQVKALPENKIELTGWGFGEVDFRFGENIPDIYNVLFDHEFSFKRILDLNTASTNTIIYDWETVFAYGKADLFDLPPRRTEYSSDGGSVEVGGFHFVLPDVEGQQAYFRASNGLEDAIIYEEDEEGLRKWAISLGGPGNDRCTAVECVSNDAAVVVTGNFEEEMTCIVNDSSSPTSYTKTLTSNGLTDVFLAWIAISDYNMDGLSDMQDHSIDPTAAKTLNRDRDGDYIWDIHELIIGSDITVADTSFESHGYFDKLIEGAHLDLLDIDANLNGFGIPDSDEFALMVKILLDQNHDSHVAVREAWLTNLDLIYDDTFKCTMPGANCRKAIYAAYMTLGDELSCELVTWAMRNIEGLPTWTWIGRYSQAAVNILPAMGDADDDTNDYTNQYEYNYVVLPKRVNFLDYATDKNKP